MTLPPDFPATTPVRPSGCPGLLRIVQAMDGGICRVKLAGGLITAQQAEAVADVAHRYASGVIEATNRSNLQIRGVGTAHQALIEPLLAVGLGPANAASDEVRNLMLSPTAGIDPQQVIDTWPLARQILGSLESTPRFAELSAKFAVQLDGGEALAMREHHHDLWLCAFECNGQPLLAFGLAGCPAQDAALGSVPVEHGHELVMTVLTLFLELARPEHTRMRHLFKERAITDFVAQLAQRLSVAIGPAAAWPRATHSRQSPIGTYPQRETGQVYVGATLALGRLDAAQLSALAKIATRYGNGTLRFTPWQGVLVPHVRAEQAACVTQALHALGLLCDAQHPLTQMVACTGSSACIKGLADTKQDARRLASLISQPQPIHLTGCLRSCAAAHVAPVTLLAVAPGHYDLYLRDPQHAGFGVLRERNLTIEAAGAWLEARQRSNTHD